MRGSNSCSSRSKSHDRQIGEITGQIVELKDAIAKLVAVSNEDATAIRTLARLVLIGEIDRLPRLFSQVLVTMIVIGELLHEDAPEAVRTWAANLPIWIESGILGLLGEAATRDFVDLTMAIDCLRKTSFRCSPNLFKTTLDRFDRRLG